MTKRIDALNSAFLSGRIGVLEYEQKARALLVGLDWMRRVKWANMLLVSV